MKKEVKEEVSEEVEEIKDLYDEVFFEIKTDLAVLSDESKEIFNQSVNYVNVKIHEPDKKIEELEEKIEKISDENKEKWNVRLSGLKDKRQELLIKTKTEIEIQKTRFQVWVDSVEDKLEYYKEEMEHEIKYSKYFNHMFYTYN